MRVGKKANVVEAKKTRSCVVRLEKVSSPPIKITRSSGITSRGIQLHSEEKRFKGPIKKRPIAQSSNTTVSPSAATPISATSTKSTKVKEMKEKFKTPIRGQKAAVVKPVLPDPPTPTIAAGRSRRAIKPNPKYASDDMVTPKIIRNVSAIAGSSSTSKRPTLVPEKQRKRSTSSSDDFFNKDSSDDFGANDFDDEVDKMYKELEKESDSDFSDEPKLTESSSKKRGRPKKGMQETPSSTPASTPRPMPTPQYKGQTSQLQLLRKSFAASVNRTVEPLAGMKRKHIDSVGSSSDNDNDAAGVARKRILLTKSAIARENKISNTTNISMLVRKPNPALNGSRILKIKSESMETEKSKRSPTIIQKRTLMDGNSVPIKINQQSKQLHTIRTFSNNTAASATATRTLITTSSKAQNARVLAESKRRSASPAVKVTKPAEDKVEDSKINMKQETSPSNNDEHEDLMPTFTIVNINDIINKKGDVLISKTGRPHNESVKTDQVPVSVTAKISEQKSGPVRRKGLLAEKVGEVNRSKSPMTTKKPTQRILNHTLIKKSPSDVSTVRNKVNSSISPEKPAPRILNSMVAKKTQPVKPMIANFEDSADDEIYPISFDGDEDVDEDDGEDTNDTEDLDEGIDDAEDSFEVSKSRLPTSTPYQEKKSAPSSKENSQAALNRQKPSKNVIQRKISPEKVVISRQGDKIVKKITCFETWYVIIPEEIKPKVYRNILDIPLIKLANIATDIFLPTDDWKSKVTLHELSPSTIAKTNLITYTGDLKGYNISEKDRGRYQPSCVMFRRSVNDRTKSRLPYDRAVIFKNKTFFTNIEGKNVKLVGAPSTISTQKDVEILLQIVDSLTLQSSLVEPTNTIQ